MSDFVKHSKLFNVYASMLKNQNTQNNAEYRIFVKCVQDIARFMEDTTDSIVKDIEFESPIDFFKDMVIESNDYNVLTKTKELVLKCEEMIRGWMFTFRKMIQQYKLEKKQPALFGPYKEIEFWRKMCIKFDRVCVLFKSKFVMFAETAMERTNSSLLKSWIIVKQRTMHFYQQISETVNFLNSFEKMFEDLYQPDIVRLRYAVENIFDAMPIAQFFSKYAFDKRSTTKVLLTCLNQMVISCVQYLTDDFTVTFWSQSKSILLKKLELCIELKDHVFYCHNKSVNKINIEDREPFRVLFITSFGNFVEFINRLDKMKNIIETYQSYKGLKKSSIPMVRKLYAELKEMFQTFTKKREDLLKLIEDRKFKTDSDQFDLDVQDLKIRLKNHIKVVIEETPDFVNKVELLKKCETLKMNDLDLETVYISTLKNINIYYRDLYAGVRDNLPFTYHLPMISCQIMWIEMINEKIKTPMKFFLSKSHNLWGENINTYNALCIALKNHELALHTEWSDQIAEKDNSSRTGPLLIRDQTTRKYSVNFSKFITEKVDIAQLMIYHRLPIPRRLQLKVQRKDMMYRRYIYAEDIVIRYNQLRQMVPDVFYNLINFELMKMDKLLIPLLNTIKWSSSGAMKTMHGVMYNFNYSEAFIKMLSDLNYILRTEIDSIGQYLLIKLPDEAVWPHEFKELNKIHLEDTIKNISDKSIFIEDVFNYAIKLILYRVNDKYSFKDEDMMYKFFNVNRALEDIKDTDGEAKRNDEKFPAAEHPTSKQVDDWCMSVFRFYNFFYTKSLVNMMRSTFEYLIDGLSYYQRTLNSERAPILKIKLTLIDSEIGIEPSWRIISSALKYVTSNALNVTTTLTRWGFNHIKMNDYFYKKNISKNKDVLAAAKEVENATRPLKMELEKVISEYSIKYQEIWVEHHHKIENINWLLEKQTELDSIRYVFDHMKQTIDTIYDEPSSVEIGPLEIQLDEFKESLREEIISWQILFANGVLESSKLKYLCKYIAEKYNIIASPINDLVDARKIIFCLEELEVNLTDLDNDTEKTVDVYDLLSEYKVPIKPDDERQLNLLTETYKKLKLEMCNAPQRLLDKYKPLSMELQEGILNLKTDIFVFDKQFVERGPMVEGLMPSEAAERVLLFQDRFEELVSLMERYQDGERLFKMPVTSYPTLSETKRVFNLLKRLYDLYSAVNRSIQTWSSTLWTRVKIDDIIDNLAEYTQKCRKLPKGLKEWPTYEELKNKIDDWSDKMILVEMMFKNSLKPRHWEMIEKATGTLFPVNDRDFALKDIMSAPLLKSKDELEDICQTAIKEIDIEAKLRQIIFDWSTIKIEMAQFKNRGFLLIKGQEIAEVVAILEDSQMVMSSLASNRYNIAFKSEIMDWVKKFAVTSLVLENWILVQNLWMYLEAVFMGGDISKQLPQETKRFTAIDKLWVTLMTKARFLENVIEICTGDGSMEILLPYMLEQLELCQKSLAGYHKISFQSNLYLLNYLRVVSQEFKAVLKFTYLDQKRNIFSRFYFISDPVLLEILGQASNSHNIGPHLLSLFDNTAKLIYSESEYDKVLQIVSKEGEKILLEHPVLCSGGVENWLNVLLNESKFSVNQIIANVDNYIMTDPQFSIITMIEKFPAQIGLIGLQLLWTIRTEYALKNSVTMKKIMKDTNQEFIKLLNILIDATTKNLTKNERLNYETLITIHVHQRDIFESLYQMKITNLLDFEWLKQERFYYTEEFDRCEVRITDVLFVYQNEFLGCSDRLVITPLTDRCYITLAQAVGMNMGGAPAGPAGTGKTETTKDMGKSLGKYVVVFNCSDQMDYRGLGRIFKGLVHSGTWGCFDEFNRIELPVLSVAAQQVYIVFMARKSNKETFVFSDGDTVPMNQEFAIFLTMNPGYAGRQELPENLKVLFRSVAMMVPDRLIIIRVKLAACGFKNNQPLSKKFFILYQLCEEQLSKQVHYDFGLRNILAVLRTLGTQRRSNPSEAEETILMRVLKGMNVSKLVDQDETIFLSLIEDLFVGMKSTSSSYKDLQTAILSSCFEKQLVNHPSWNLKIIQVYETSLVRHGLMILGPTGSGKTTAIHCLLSALTKTGLTHFEYRMNPKAITASQMFGRLDVATNDWTDGIFSTLWRRTLKLSPDEYCWIVLDGPVDAVWIENLNSVLDDNKTLTLANGDRIVMAPNAKLCFEPDNVDNASPATISRMGMTFFSATVLSWRVIFGGWGKTKSEYLSNCFQDIFDDSYSELLKMLQSRLTPKMTLLEPHYIHQTCDILDGLLSMFPEDVELSVKILSRLYTFAVMWSIAAVLESDNRLLLEEFILKDLAGKVKVPKLKEGESIYDYTISKKGEWIHWETLIEPYTYPTDYIPVYGDILVPNLDNVRTMFLITLIANQEKNVLLIGEQGTAKTVMIKSYMQEFDPEVRVSKMLNFSSATTPNMFQSTVEGYMEKRFGTTYGPPGNRKMTIFIDDINMPIINDWGDQVTNEITRQLLQNKGFYSLTKPGDFVHIVGVNMLGAMIHPGGGRNDVPPRLKRQFCIFNCTLPSDTSMDKIFGALGCGYFCVERFNEQVVQFLPSLVALTRIVWQKTKQKLLPTPANFHYVFNLRDLSRIWEGMLQICSAECPDVRMLLRLWCHELQRVVYDKLTSSQDKDWFLETVRSSAEKFLGRDSYRMMPANMKTIVFVDFMRDMVDPTGDEPDDFEPETPNIYESIEDFEVLKDRMLMFMGQMKEATRGTVVDLVFFRDCMVHLIIIARILRIPRGNGLLVGVGGSGRRSVTTLASFIAKYKQHSIFLTRSYNVNNFLDDIRILYRFAGIQDTKTTFVFTDNDIKEESFLEYINNILSSGEVANLFPKDELEEMLNSITPLFKKKSPRGNPSMDNLYQFFIKQAMNNLHLVLCFSPIGESFRLRSLKFPGLISGCIIDWYTAWPTDALLAVSHYFLDDFYVVGTIEEKTSLIQLLGVIHDNVAKDCTSYFQRFRRKIFVTPKSFLSFVNDYKTLYVKNIHEIEQMKMQRVLGLEKLADASIQVGRLKEELTEKEKEMAIATEASTEVTTKVNIVVKAAEISKAEVAVVKDRAELLLKSISKEKKIAEIKLAKAKPALDAAEAALLTLTATDIATVRKLGKPPYLITVIMDSVLIFFQRKLLKVILDTTKVFLEPNWKESLKLMSDTRFLFNLQNYPKNRINGETIDLLQPYFKYQDYTFEKAKLACGNVAGLLSWTLAMSDFYNVNKEVLPLIANLAKQEGKHVQAKEQLKAAETIAFEKNKELLEAKKKLNIALGSQQIIQNEADKCKNKMNSATALIEGLEGERKRWKQQLAGFNLEIKYSLGDIVILTAFLNYSGPFNQEFRTQILQSWYDQLNERSIPNSPSLNVSEKLADPPTISEWNLQGLPNDELSIQNGIIVTKSSKYPIMIDPQSQGIAWIKNKEAVNNMVVTTFDDKYFRNYLEDSLSLGKPLLIYDVQQDVDPIINNVLEKNYYVKGKFINVLLGDKEIDVSEDFRLYLTSKLGNPSYPPELYAKCIIIDFTVTIKGLEDQLLSRVIEIEKKELEQERIELIAEVTSQKRKMQKLEHDLLIKLTTVKGSLVDDESVLYTLNKTKDTATDVSEKIEVANKTQASISVMREQYRPIATRGSVLYFLIVEMGMVNPMYQNSLQQFLEQFDKSLSNSEKTVMLERRINNIIEYLTYAIYKYKCRGLYEKHKILFTILMTLKIDLERGKITRSQFEYFIKGGASVDIASIKPKPFDWVTDICWLNLGLLQTISPFQSIMTAVEINGSSWKKWYEKSSPEKEKMPDGFDRLDVFERLLMVRAWCPDRTMNQAFAYVEESLGPEFVETVMFDIEEMYLESKSITPMICFLSMGSDPSGLIENTAKKLEIPFYSVSMGQGQEVHAERLMKECATNGGWVLLQNCHLCLNFMQETFTYINTQVALSTQENFRIWITTEVHPKFSISLLQISIHFTYEPPEGLRAGLMRTFINMGDDTLVYSSISQYKPILYVISFLHSVVQERRKFGPVGWNIPYEFNTSDWYSSTLYLQKMVDDMEPTSEINWVALRYMLAEVHYGGRVTDDYDRRLLNNFTELWFTNDMFSKQFCFYEGYNVLVFNKLTEYLAAIDEMPLKDPPQACGLHPNTDITYQTNMVQEMFNTIIMIQPKGSGGGSEVTREEKVYNTSSDLLDKLPLAFNMFIIKERLTLMGPTQPMNIFLGQEIERIQKVTEIVKNTLEDLLLAIDGIIIMNEVLSETLDYLYDGRIPAHWLRASWTSSTIGFWFNELLNRHSQITTWVFREKPAQFWMTGFFNPQGFLTAMKQEISRAHKGWTLDNIVLENEVTLYYRQDVKKPPLEGVYVYGLFLDGASWNRKEKELQESLHKIMFTEMPVIHIYAINTIGNKLMPGYGCPVYKKPSRTGLTYVCELRLRSPKGTLEAHWISRGVALLCDIK